MFCSFRGTDETKFVEDAPTIGRNEGMVPFYFAQGQHRKGAESETRAEEALDK